MGGIICAWHAGGHLDLQWVSLDFGMRNQLNSLDFQWNSWGLGANEPLRPSA